MNAQFVPDNIKMNLRSVLITKSGMKQSIVCNEYKELLQEPLVYNEYGFKTFYDFLCSLEGEVVRLEFSEKDSDNLVYCIADETKYTSKHAIKNAQRVRSCLKAKSPDEIIEWKKSYSPAAPVTGDTVTQQKSEKEPIVKDFLSRVIPAENIPKQAEWEMLRRLKPNKTGMYKLRVVFRYKTLNVNEVKKHFKQYGCLGGNTMAPQKNFFPAFPSFVAAYFAWRESHGIQLCGARINVEPAIEKTFNIQINTDVLREVLVCELPQDLIMSSLVTAFAKYDGFLAIDPHPKERSVVIAFAREKFAENILTDKIMLTGIDGRDFPAIIKDFRSSACDSALQQQRQGLETMSSTSQPPAFRYPPITPNGSLKMLSSQSEESEEVKMNTFDHLTCAFRMDYQLFSNMFRATCKEAPRTSQSFPDKIRFLVTYLVDACRFWIQIVDEQNPSHQKLQAIHKSLADSADQILPPTSLPKNGQRGAALFDVDEQWYRCYVLSSSIETEEIEVFFCDYGNSAHVKITDFRSTYKEVWAVPPLAVPCKLNGLENCQPKDSIQREKAMERLTELTYEKGFNATVVKSGKDLQPHIIELRDMRVVGGDAQDSIEHVMQRMEYLAVAGSQDAKNFDRDMVEKKKLHSGKTPRINPSIFEYDPTELLFGRITEIHNFNLIYLHLGPINDLSNLESGLQATIPKLGCVAKKGAVLLKNINGERRRVMVLGKDNRTKQVEVLHVDYGVIEKVPDYALYSLENAIRDVPFQARPAFLAGLDCSQNPERIIEVLKNKKELPIQANIIKELPTGQVSVELFEMENGQSINYEILQSGFLFDKPLDNNYTQEIDLVSNFSGSSGVSAKKNSVASSITASDRCSTLRRNTADGIFTANAVHRSRNMSGSSSDSWACEVKVPPFCELSTTDSRSNNNDRIPMKKPHKKSDVQRWIENQIPNSNSILSGDVHCGGEQEDAHLSRFPPDIISSNTLPHIFQYKGFTVEGRKVCIGNNPATCDSILLDVDCNVNRNDVENLRKKWQGEKHALLQIKAKLEHMTRLLPHELENAFKELKKEKLQLILRLRDAEKKFCELNTAYGAVVTEANHIYAQI